MFGNVAAAIGALMLVGGMFWLAWKGVAWNREQAATIRIVRSENPPTEDVGFPTEFAKWNVEIHKKPYEGPA